MFHLLIWIQRFDSLHVMTTVNRVIFMSAKFRQIDSMWRSHKEKRERGMLHYLLYSITSCLCSSCHQIKQTIKLSLIVSKWHSCKFLFQDVFILDTKAALFVWIGKGTSENERRNAMTYAHVSMVPLLLKTGFLCASGNESSQ